MAKVWAIVFLGQKLTSFLNAKMAGQKVIVIKANQLFSNNFGDEQ